MSNFLPLDGCLAPRSRLSSVNTIRPSPMTVGAGITKMTELTAQNFAQPIVWLSTGTSHGVVQSTGSISMASFVSAFGLGVAGLATHTGWQHAQTFSSNLNENMLVAAGQSSAASILVLYHTGGLFTGAPLYSYLTGAPKAKAVGTHDNYVICLGVSNAGNFYGTRVQWSARGEASAWTVEGSGFEDLITMRGVGTAVVSAEDQRFILFSESETWYGVSATYPAQFLFAPLDRGVGCPFPDTIQRTDMGIIFLGSDLNLRLLPFGAGQSQVIVPSMQKLLRWSIDMSGTVENTFGVYNPSTRIYRLFNRAGTTATKQNVAINVDTGVWGFEDYNATAPFAGCAINLARSQYVGNEGVFYGNSSGTVFSTNSLIAQENGSAVTSFIRLGPIASDLPGDYKQITKLALDYRATSKSTVTAKVSQDGGNNFETTGQVLSLASAPFSGRVERDVYIGGAFPVIELKSESTGYELHRLDVTLNINGRK